MKRFLVFRSRRFYWSHSRIARAILGVDVPVYNTLEGWDEFWKEVKKDRPIRYFIAEKLIDKLQNLYMFIPDVIYTIKYKFNSRFVGRYWALDTGLNRYSYYDLDTRIETSLIKSLIDYVEIEKAWMQTISTKSTKRAKKRKFKRSPSDGIKYLIWESNLTNDDGSPCRQAKDAIEILDIYQLAKAYVPPDKREYISLEHDEIEYNKNTDLLKRIIEIRGSLWT